jgi:hypothetical protein
MYSPVIVTRRLCGNSVIESMIFSSQVGVHVLEFCVLRTTLCSNSEDKLIDKTVGYWVLKPHLHYMKILCFRQNIFLVYSVSKKSCDTTVIWRRWGRTFLSSAVITHCFVTVLVYLKNKNKINSLPFIRYTLYLSESWVQCNFGYCIIKFWKRIFLLFWRVFFIKENWF